MKAASVRKSQKKQASYGHSCQERHGLDAILSNMAEGVVIESGDYRVEFMNHALQRKFGNQVGKECYRAFFGRSKPCPGCSLKKVIHGGKKSFTCTAVDKKGRCYEMVATPLNTDGGNSSVIEIIRDVTAEQAAWEKLTDQKELSENIVQHIADGVMAVDLSGIIISCNPVFRKKLRISVSQLLGKEIWKVMTSVTKTQWQRLFRMIKGSGRCFRWGPVSLQHRDREELVRVKIAPLHDRSDKTRGFILFFEFITSKVKVEEQLKESKKFYEILFRDISESVVVVKNHKVIWCNQRTEEVTGFSHKELVGHTPAWLFSNGKAYEKFTEEAYGVLAKQNRFDAQARLRRKNGEYFDAEFSLSAMHRDKGQVTEIIAVARDVSARKAAEKESRERAQRLAILNKVGAKIGSSIQLKDILTFVAKSILKLSGLDSCSIVLCDPDSSQLQEYVSIGLEDKFQKTLRWRLRPGGVTEWAVKNRKPLVISDTLRDPRSADSRATKIGGVRALVAVPILSEEKVIGLIFVNSFRAGHLGADAVAIISSIASQAAGALESARLYKQVSEKVQELSALHLVGQALVSTLDLPGLLREVTAVLHRSFGYSHCAILLLNRETMELTIGGAVGVTKKRVRDLCIDAARHGVTGWVARTGRSLYVPDVFKDSRYISGIKGIKSELAVPLKRGEEVIGVLDVESKRKDGFGDRDLRVLTTVAAQMAMAIENAKLYEEVKRAYEDLKGAQADVVQAGRMAAVGQLAAGIAHELNNPMGGILGYAQFALAKLQDIDGQEASREDLANITRYLGYIERESERCKSIVQNLLNFSRSSPLSYQSTDLNKVIARCLQLMEHNLVVNNVIVVKRFAKDLPTIVGDVNQLEQVFINIILNAQKAMTGGGTLKVCTRKIRATHRSGTFVEAAFADSGCGIAQQHLAHIFEPFFTTRKIGEGTGLGLSVSYRIIKDHGGEILVQSEVNRGTTLAVRLPFAGSTQGSASDVDRTIKHGRSQDG